MYKKSFLFIMLISLSIISCDKEIPDPTSLSSDIETRNRDLLENSWIIKNSFGIDCSIANCNYSNSITNDRIVIESLNQPGEDVPGRGIDLFILFTNGDTYSSYHDNENVLLSGNTIGNYEIFDSRSILYAKKTNVYEDDDPPPDTLRSLKVENNITNNYSQLSLGNSIGNIIHSNEIIACRDLSIVLEGIVPNELYRIEFDNIIKIQMRIILD